MFPMPQIIVYKKLEECQPLLKLQVFEKEIFMKMTSFAFLLFAVWLDSAIMHHLGSFWADPGAFFIGQRA